MKITQPKCLGPGESASLWSDRRTQNWMQAQRWVLTLGFALGAVPQISESALSWGRAAEVLKHLPWSSGLRVKTALDVESL